MTVGARRGVDICFFELLPPFLTQCFLLCNGFKVDFSAQRHGSKVMKLSTELALWSDSGIKYQRLLPNQLSDGI